MPWIWLIPLPLQPCWGRALLGQTLWGQQASERAQETLLSCNKENKTAKSEERDLILKYQYLRDVGSECAVVIPIINGYKCPSVPRKHYRIDNTLLSTPDTLLQAWFLHKWAETQLPLILKHKSSGPTSAWRIESKVPTKKNIPDAHIQVCNLRVL